MNFKWKKFKKEIIIMALRWYVAYSLSYRQTEEILKERGSNRDAASAKRFFQKAKNSSGKPEKINIDKSGSNLSALNNINQEYKTDSKIEIIRKNKYLNNMVEQDHRFIKKICKPMLGFFSLASTRATLCGIKLHHMLRKGQRKLKNHLPIWKQFCELAV